MVTNKRFDWDINGVYDYKKEDYIEDSHKAYSDLLNDLNSKNQELRNRLTKTIQGRIKVLEERLEDSFKDNTPRSSSFSNPMSETYRKEYRDEIHTLKWFLELIWGV